MKIANRLAVSGTVVTVLACLTAPLDAATIVLNPSGDTFITSESGNADTNYGSAPSMTLTGGAGTGVNAGLFRFDLSAIPAGATIDSVTFGVYVESVIAGTFFQVRQVTSDWVASEATWNNSKAGTPWTTAGGDVQATALANDDILTGEIGKYQVWPSSTSTPSQQTAEAAALKALVESWITNSSTNYGVMIRRFGGNTAQGFTLTTSEGVNKPQLTIHYTPVPEPASIVTLGSAALALILPRRRRIG